MHLSVFDFFIFLRYFSLSEVDEHFGKYIIARWAKRAQIFSIELTFKGESHALKNFPKFKDFTLSWSKVWILLISDRFFDDNWKVGPKRCEFSRIIWKQNKFWWRDFWSPMMSLQVKFVCNSSSGLEFYLQIRNILLFIIQTVFSAQPTSLNPMNISLYHRKNSYGP